MFYLPLPILFFIILILLFPLLLILIQLNILEIALSNLGLSPIQSFLFLIAVLIGSMINIPIWKKDTNEIIVERHLLMPFMKNRINNTVIAVNVGGCVLPIILTLKLLPSLPFSQLLLGILIVSIGAYYSSQPVKYIGIRIAFILPLILTLITSIILVNSDIRAAYAFTIGTWGILIGADILHLKDIEKIGAGVLSIGGAGVFDSIFIIGVISAFLF